MNEGLFRKLQSISDTLKAQKQLNTEHKSLNTAKPQTTNNDKNFPKVQKYIPNHVCNDSANLQKQIRDSEKSSLPAEQSRSESKAPLLKPKTRTLIIGDAILKGISKRGLEAHVDIRTLPGRKVSDIHTNLQRMDLTSYKIIIIYVGGNDAAEGKTSSVYTTFRSSISELQYQISLCTICPRKDVDVVPLNDIIIQACKGKNATKIDCYQSFIYADGKPARPLYGRDFIHLNGRGSSALVAAINRHISITCGRRNAIESNDRGNRNIVNYPRKNNFHGQNGQFVKARSFNGRYRNPSQKKTIRNDIYKQYWNCGLFNHTVSECRFLQR